jgi:hypothetical protein
MNIINWKAFRGSRNLEPYNRHRRMHIQAHIENTYEMGICKKLIIDEIQVLYLYVFTTILFVYKCILARPHLKYQCR